MYHFRGFNYHTKTSNYTDSSFVVFSRAAQSIHNEMVLISRLLRLRDLITWFVCVVRRAVSTSWRTYLLCTILSVNSLFGRDRLQSNVFSCLERDEVLCGWDTFVLRMVFDILSGFSAEQRTRIRLVVIHSPNAYFNYDEICEKEGCDSNKLLWNSYFYFNWNLK